ncbi:MAG TPA: cell division protein SepF [Acidimicrobiales bacterium]|nr:cell division protein SepF [Acidimicrobiales bacterium]
MWRKALIHLGLGDDADYDQYQVDGAAPQPDRDDHLHRPVTGRPAAPEPLLPAYSDEPSAIGEVRPINTRGPAARDAVAGSGQTVNPTGVAGSFGGQSSIRPRPQVVRPVPITANAKPHVVVPASFNQAQDVADKFKTNQPVVMNLQGADRELSRRLIDFASGLCYGLGGQMERLVNQVYLLTPGNVEVSADERRRLEERGYEP